jgi:hypothetical protein
MKSYKKSNIPKYVDDTIDLENAEPKSEDENMSESSYDVKNRLKRTKKLREQILKEENIEKKLELYTTILTRICEEMREKKLSLDLYYSYLNKISSYSQTSIIGLSAASTFIQSIKPQEEQSNFIKIVILSITSYSGLILAITKFYKLDEKRENAHNLRDRFADLQTKIQYFIDYIKPWENEAHYQHIENGKDKVTEWVSLIEKIENEYNSIIESKRELTATYDKIIDSYVTKTFTKKYLQILLELEKEKQTEIEKLDNYKLKVLKDKSKRKREMKTNDIKDFDRNYHLKKNITNQIKLTKINEETSPAITKQRQQQRNNKNSCF